MVADGADRQSPYSEFRGQTVDAGGLHFHPQHLVFFHQCEYILFRCVEQVAGEDIAHVKNESFLLGSINRRAQQPVICDRGKIMVSEANSVHF